jgi:hypothetical protein
LCVTTTSLVVPQIPYVPTVILIMPISKTVVGRSRGNTAYSDTKSPTIFDHITRYSKSNRRRDKRDQSDASHWLMNASIILGTDIGKAVNPLTMNQLFAVQKLP